MICGHIHTAALHDDFGLRYINCGDWVESCTAVAENYDGSFEIITWTQSGDGSEQRPETDIDVGMDAIMNGMRQAAE